jgi:hypothetical protein
MKNKSINQSKREALIASILASKASIGGSHCSRCGHCIATV